MHRLTLLGVEDWTMLREREKPCHMSALISLETMLMWTQNVSIFYGNHVLYEYILIFFCFFLPSSRPSFSQKGKPLALSVFKLPSLMNLKTSLLSVRPKLFQRNDPRFLRLWISCLCILQKLCSLFLLLIHHQLDLLCLQCLKFCNIGGLEKQNGPKTKAKYFWHK